jgi:hypothetical protein
VGDTTQDGNYVGGDLAGGNISKHVYHFNFPSASASGSDYIAKLILKFRAEQERSAVFRETIERLQHYTTPVVEMPLKTLEEKLSDGKRTDLLPLALVTKEMFTKKLLKHSFSESAQEMHAFLLAEVYTRFNDYVYVQIKDNAPKSVINHCIRESIVSPLLAILGENVLKHYADDINGMLYFLTGNCHIKWV